MGSAMNMLTPRVSSTKVISRLRLETIKHLLPEGVFAAENILSTAELMSHDGTFSVTSNKQVRMIDPSGEAELAELVLHQVANDLLKPAYGPVPTNVARFRSQVQSWCPNVCVELLDVLTSDKARMAAFVAYMRPLVDQARLEEDRLRKTADALDALRLEFVMSRNVPFELEPTSGRVVITAGENDLSSGDLPVALALRTDGDALGDVTESAGMSDVRLRGLTSLEHDTLVHLAHTFRSYRTSGISLDEFSSSVELYLEDPLGWVFAGRNRDDRRHRALGVAPAMVQASLATPVVKSCPSHTSGVDYVRWVFQNVSGLPVDEVATLMVKAPQHGVVLLLRTNKEARERFFEATKRNIYTSR